MSSSNPHPVTVRLLPTILPEERELLRDMTGFLLEHPDDSGMVGMLSELLDRLIREKKAQLVSMVVEGGVLVPDVCAAQPSRRRPIEQRAIPRLTVMKGGVS